MPDLARQARQRSLGRRRPSGGNWRRRKETRRIHESVRCAPEENCFAREPAPGISRRHVNGTAAEADRQRAVIRRVAAEALGSALLLAIVVGSGIMGQNLAAGNNAVALLANTLATGAGLFALITMFGPISGA